MYTVQNAKNKNKKAQPKMNPHMREAYLCLFSVETKMWSKKKSKQK